MRIAILSLLVFLVCGDEPRFGDFAGAEDWPGRQRWMTLERGGTRQELAASARSMSIESITLDHRRGGLTTSYEVTLSDALRMDIEVTSGFTLEPWTSSSREARRFCADLSPIDFGRLVQLLEASRFDACDDDFPGFGSLNPPISLRVRRRDGHVQETRFGVMVAPIELWTVTRLIDAIVQRADWVPLERASDR